MMMHKKQALCNYSVHRTTLARLSVSRCGKRKLRCFAASRRQARPAAICAAWGPRRAATPLAVLAVAVLCDARELGSGGWRLS
eukprot:5903002-Pleurochrysis_carterae.AAC.3